MNSVEHPPYRPDDEEPQPEKKRLSTFEDQKLPPEVILEIEKTIQDIVNNPELYIDHGGSGSVHHVSQDICIKVIPKRVIGIDGTLSKRTGNTRLEAGLQKGIYNIVTAEGARVPYCYGFSEADDLDKPDVIVMEQLRAVNVQRALNREVPFPPNFNAESFLDSVEDFLCAMHEAGVAHMDFYPRNVMIDQETGEARIIDFGRSVRLSTLSPKEAEEAKNSDFELFNELYDQLMSAWEELNKK